MNRWVVANLCCLALASPVPAQDVVAALTSDLQPYRAALAGLEQELGMEVPVLLVSQDVPNFGPGTRIVVSFGSKAATRSYPETATLVFCMAPGMRADEIPHRGRKVEVRMSPPMGSIVARFRDLQPNLRRLGVVWISESIGDEIEENREALRQLHVELVEMHLDRASGLPGALRSQGRSLDAIWLPPDPLLVTESSFTMLRSFSQSNKVPFYAPTEGLAAKGAVAAVATSFEEIGRTTGRVIRQLRAGEAPPRHVYPRTSRLTLNAKSATDAGLSVTAEVIRRADQVTP